MKDLALVRSGIGTALCALPRLLAGRPDAPLSEPLTLRGGATS